MEDAVGMEDWEQFKKELYELYPGSIGEKKYLVANLKSLTEKQAIETLKHLEYIKGHPLPLHHSSKINPDREISAYFLQGMDYTFRNKVQDQLRAENPTHHSDNPYTLTEISKVALFVLSCNPPEDTRNEGSQGPSFKKEHYDILKLDPNFLNGNINISALVSEIVKQLNLQPAGSSGTQGPASTSAPRIGDVYSVQK